MHVQFLKSVLKKDDLPKDNENRKEIVFVGRSNVGKSSLLNYLTGRNIAKVGKTPGRTRAINYFIWDFDGFKTYLVDLPGYGFARGDKKEIENWKRLIETYFRERKDRIALVLLLVDAKVGPTEQDIQMMDWLEYLGIPYTVVLTKTDADVKGGTAISVAGVIEKPIAYIGVGQEYKDLVRFEAKKFVKELVLSLIHI
jgi:GTP-binding protein